MTQIHSTEILETIRMVSEQNFDVRTITIGIDLHDCISPDINTLNRNIYNKITRVGELIGQEAARLLGIPFGILDLSLAPTPAVGDSVARILEAMGLSVCGTHGTTAALALLNDAVKKGGMMAR